MGIRRGSRSGESSSFSVETPDSGYELERLAAAPLPQPLHISTACCCQAPARVRILLPVPADPQRWVDLLFCLHHFREHAEKLTMSGAIVVHDAPPAEPVAVAAQSGALVPSPR